MRIRLNFSKHLGLCCLCLLNLSAWNSIAQTNNTYEVVSPDKHTQAIFTLNDKGDLTYSLNDQRKKVIDWSELGLTLNNVSLGKNTSIKSTTRKTHAEKFKWPLGENEFVENNYNEINMACSSGSINFNLVARVFNGSLAFKYEVPQQTGIKDVTITAESTSFNFNQAYQIYQYHHESVFTPVDLNALITTCDLPATLSNGHFYLSIGEANNTSYTKAELGKGQRDNSLNLVFERDKDIRFDTAFESPWRTISMSTTAIGLHQYSDLFLKLSPAPTTMPSESIKPGKVIRSELNTQAGLDCIDLASKLNFSHILLDAGWYGPERALSSDPAIPIPQIDLPKVIQYGKQKGIGVILYVNYIGLQNHIDRILPLYKQWGISGLKFGFIDGFSQKGLTWLSGAIKKVNDQGLLLNIHDNYKPTGLSRTYPYLLTQEGIRGDENSPDAFHTTVLPFTRFLAGAADFTFCFPNPKNNFGKNLKVSKAQQLALTVVYFSPLQAIFWYGKPNDYTNEEEIEFFKYVPTVWDQSLYLDGEIGKNISVARRKGKTWYVGNAAGLKDWKGQINLDFLNKNQKYQATIYEDDEKGSIRKRMVTVKKGDQLPFEIKVKAGLAMIIE